MATSSFRRILELLERHEVEYVVVGGVAAVLQGAPVTTFDIDTLVKVEPANVERLANALSALDARFRERLELRPTREDLAAGGHLLLMTNSGPLDVLGFIAAGKRYEDVVDVAARLTVDELTIRVLPLEQLIEDKKVLGRDKDIAVIRLLEAALARRRER
jgi:hypothetical protein